MGVAEDKHAFGVETLVNKESGTTIAFIGNGVYRISTAHVELDRAFNQFLIVDEKPLLFHSGFRRDAAVTQQAVETVLDSFSDLAYICFSHIEGDECGALKEHLEAAPKAQVFCSQVSAVSASDIFAIKPHGFADGEKLSLGPRHTIQWFDTPHLPHGRDAGYIHSLEAETLFCGDLFTQKSYKSDAIVEGYQTVMQNLFEEEDYFVLSQKTGHLLEKLRLNNPRTLATMHGASIQSQGSEALSKLIEWRRSVDYPSLRPSLQPRL
jgi:flavorubredoxin